MELVFEYLKSLFYGDASARPHPPPCPVGVYGDLNGTVSPTTKLTRAHELPPNTSKQIPSSTPTQIPGSALDSTAPGRLFRDAVAAAQANPGAVEAGWIERIEALRTELLATQEILGPWTSPWFDSSEELRERYGRAKGDGHQRTMPISEACEASKPPRWCRLLWSLVRAFRPGTALEMGTNIGVSGLYLTAAMEAENHGRLITLEGAPPKSELARKNFERLGLAQRADFVVGDFNETLEPTLARVGPVDLAFVDGFHDGPATVRFHEVLKKHTSPDAVLVYDDITWSDGMKRAWQTILADPDVGVALDLGSVGFCTLGGEKVRASAKF